MKELKDLQVGDSIYFLEEEKPEFVVQAKRDQYLVAHTKDTGEKYTIIDTEHGFCGPDDRTFSFIRYKTKEGCEEALTYLLDGVDVPEHEGLLFIDISRRHRANVEDVINLKKTLG